MSVNVEKIKNEIISSFNKGITDKKFNELALKIFSYQFEKIPSYRRYCENLGVSPYSISSFQEIPPCPQRAFKLYDITTENPDNARYLFLSSGTTEGIKSKNYIFYPEIYENSSIKTFKEYVLPDIEKLHIFVLFPSFKELPHSSLAYMFDRILKTFGDKKSKHTTNESLSRYLVKNKEPVLLLCTSLSLKSFLEYLGGKKIELPEGSRIVDTGGFKGRKAETTQEELYSICKRKLNIEPEFIVNEYGMCELGSQYYDTILKSHFEGENKNTRIKKGPSWIKFRIVKPDTLEDADEGILIHYDLTNLTSCISVLTEDKALKVDKGFVLYGRPHQYSLRGCSLIYS